MKITECIILAGGLGTRIRSEVPDLPKCLAPVAGKPFLHFVISYLLQQNIERFIFSVGYMHLAVEEFIDKEFPGIDAVFAVEKEPLGTGGAIRHSCSVTTQKDVVILNGDTLFNADISKLAVFHKTHEAACTLSLKPMADFDRYGVVEINQEGFVQSFREKQHYQNGLINAGVYALNVSAFLELPLSDKFSFEKDYLEAYYKSEKMMGLVQDVYFIDIGIPEDLRRAGIELINLKS